MKKISILFSLVLLATSCVKQMEEPESAKIAGMWAVVDDNGFSNKYINIGFIVLTLLQVLIFITPIRDILHIVPLNLNQVMIIIVINIISFIFIELIKPVVVKKFKD